MKIYIDTDDRFKCYTTDTGGLLEYEEPFFNGKCPELVESYCCKPVGYELVTENGEVVQTDCKLVAPWKDLSEAYAAQAAYVTAQNAQYEAALSEIEAALGVTS